jgi:hypothetical protein
MTVKQSPFASLRGKIEMLVFSFIPYPICRFIPAQKRLETPSAKWTRYRVEDFRRSMGMSITVSKDKLEADTFTETRTAFIARHIYILAFHYRRKFFTHKCHHFTAHPRFLRSVYSLATPPQRTPESVLIYLCQ